MRHGYLSIQLGVLVALAATAAAEAQQPPVQLPPAVLSAPVSAQAQPAPGRLQSTDPYTDSAFVRFFRDGEWYASWGYSKQYWTPTDIHVSQPSLGNEFTIHSVHGADEFSFSDIFGTDLFGPQYNIRVGRFVDDARTIAIEFSLDHSRYTTTLGQSALVTGQVAGAPTSAFYQLNNQFFNEQLHNGANHLMINAVYRYPLIGKTNETFSVAAIGKLGVGLMVPHTSDIIMGNAVNVGTKTPDNMIGLTNGWWQLNGWTTGVEFGLRAVLYKPVYLEVTDKLAYSSMLDLPAYMGTIRESLFMNEIIVSLGVTYDGASLHPSH